MFGPAGVAGVAGAPAAIAGGLLTGGALGDGPPGAALPAVLPFGERDTGAAAPPVACGSNTVESPGLFPDPSLSPALAHANSNSASANTLIEARTIDMETPHPRDYTHSTDIALTLLR
jgi:hypothetical protein